VAGAGGLLGLASFFTQTAGLAGALAVLLTLAWEHVVSYKSWRSILRQQVVLLSFLTLVFCALSAHFIVTVGWRQLWYLWGVYPQRYVMNQLFRPGIFNQLILPALSTLVQRVFIYGLTIWVCPVVCWHCWRRRQESDVAERIQLVLLSLSGSFLFLEVVSRANWVRIYSVSMPAVLLFVWLLAGEPRRYLKAALWAIVACSALQQTTSRHRHSRVVMDLPAGRTVLANELYEDDELSWLAQHTKPDELFFQAEWLNMYFPLKLRSPVFAEFLSKAMPSDYLDLTQQQIEQKRVKYILWSPWLPPPEGPPMSGWTQIDPFRAYLCAHYAPVQVFANRDAVWQRKETLSNKAPSG